MNFKDVLQVLCGDRNTTKYKVNNFQNGLVIVECIFENDLLWVRGKGRGFYKKEIFKGREFFVEKIAEFSLYYKNINSLKSERYIRDYIGNKFGINDDEFCWDNPTYTLYSKLLKIAGERKPVITC